MEFFTYQNPEKVKNIWVIEMGVLHVPGSRKGEEYWSDRRWEFFTYQDPERVTTNCTAGQLCRGCSSPTASSVKTSLVGSPPKSERTYCGLEPYG